ncbi:hypothetical protein FKW77_010911 [Venturia effusa]|uniref:37S ribosomal protein S22 n=1 Tax=Venturia effusa TaxID=50376 RepID=A0A517KYU1_9PEZI|nr:hypothetical protein FKW77_010911 [Venturia effusa]
MEHENAAVHTTNDASSSSSKSPTSHTAPHSLQTTSKPPRDNDPAIEGSFYDTAEFKTVFGGVLRQMEERGEKWEEDGIAEMDAAVEKGREKEDGPAASRHKDGSAEMDSKVEAGRDARQTEPAVEEMTQSTADHEAGIAEVAVEIQQIYERARALLHEDIKDGQHSQAENARTEALAEETRQMIRHRRVETDREWHRIWGTAEDKAKEARMTEEEKVWAQEALEKEWGYIFERSVGQATESPGWRAYDNEVLAAIAQMRAEKKARLEEACARAYGRVEGNGTLEQAKMDEKVIQEQWEWLNDADEWRTMRIKEYFKAEDAARNKLGMTEIPRRYWLTADLRELLVANTKSRFDLNAKFWRTWERGSKLRQKQLDMAEALMRDGLEGVKWIDQQETNEKAKAKQEVEESTVPLTPAQQLESTARAARNEFGDTLPEGYLSDTEYGVYQRLYGSPSRFTHTEEKSSLEEKGPGKNMLLRQTDEGLLEEVDYVLPAELDQVVDDNAELEEDDVLLDQQDNVLEEEPADTEDADGVKLDDRIFAPQEVDEVALTFDEYVSEQDNRPLTKEEALDKIMNEWPGDEYIRTHALTKSGRYGTNPSTLPLPRAAFIDPVQRMLAPLANKHLAEAARKSLGGLGIPLSPNTPRIGMRMEMQPIPLTSFQTKMSDREADVYMSAVMPQTYASLTSILVEVRKRLGASWLQNLLRKEGGPLIMDAGAGGAGVIAWRELLRAEWEGMHKAKASEVAALEDGIIPELSSEESEVPPVPFGRSTVVMGSDSLRQRISKILENTTFIPRIPDQVEPQELVGPQPRKRYDVILAPHTLWPIKEDYQRKGLVETLWSLLNPDGGILVIMEKGVPRGFEVVAGARDMLLKRHIASPGSESFETPLDDQKQDGVGRWTEKEKGCIIAPCTNHTTCPLYKVHGIGRGRKDWCYFSQRYTRPPALMTVLGAKARNHDDVEYSYVAVQRGVDQRTPEGDSLFGRGFTQGAPATEKALDGYGASWTRESESANEDEIVDEEAIEAETNLRLENVETPHPLSLPRALLTPLKRKGNVIIDVCTPSGTFERWLVNKRNGRQIFRDARKAKWGDLWALGARSASERRVNVGVVEDRKKDGIRKDRRAGRKGLGKRGKGRWADGDGGKLGMGAGGMDGRGGGGIRKGVVVEGDEDDY